MGKISASFMDSPLMHVRTDEPEGPPAEFEEGLGEKVDPHKTYWDEF